MADKNIAAIYRLSPLQEGILFHTLEAPGSDVYFQQYTCRLDGLDDCSRWEEAWARVAQQHAVMRTLFSWDKRDHPLQIVRERVFLPWEHLDWRDMNAPDQLSGWASLLTRDRHSGFDFSTAPLMRFTLARVSSNSYRFLWSFHHILLDGWSQRLIFSEVLDAYRNPGVPAQLTEEVSPQYGDFIRWLESFDLHAARSFWSSRLGGFTKPTYIAGRAPVRGEDAGDTAREMREIEVDAALADRLSRMARDQHLTLNTLVVAAWSLVLGVHNRSADVVFGSTVSGRPVDLAGAERIAGLMINTLPLRVEIAAEAPLVDWLRQLQSTQLGMREYEHTPLVEIQKCSALAAGSALFDSIVVFENIPGGAAQSPADSFPLVSEPGYTEYSHYPLALLVDPGEKLKLIAVYQPGRIGEDRAGRLLLQIIATLDSLCRTPEALVGDIRVLPGPELARLTLEWNRTDADFPDDRCIHELFEECARISPDTVALICGDDSLSFAQVNAAANQLARYLAAIGVGPGSLVPVFMERGIDAVVSFLAIMKTGAAYIPLDSGFPQERIAQIADDLPGNHPVMVTQQNLLENLPDTQCRAVCPQAVIDEISPLAKENLNLPVSPGDLAYVIYTSGSTGLPKGVMIEHRSLVNSTCARLDYYPLQPGVFLLLSSLAVDSSVAGLYWCLCGGATLLIATPRLELDVERIGQLIEHSGVSHLLCIASLYQLILENNPPDRLRSLKTVIVAGEACVPGIVADHQAALPDTQLYNEYGPSECTVWASVADLCQWQQGQPVPIGRPIANTSFYVLDARRRPVPIGVPGELYIGGAGLARGYLNRPDDTAVAFVEGETMRLYKTGDLVRYLENGSVEFLGRVDNQIKVRGYRIEPEEIEQALEMHPSVAEVVVFYDRGQVDEQGNETELLLRELALMDEDVVSALLEEAEALTEETLCGTGVN